MKIYGFPNSRSVRAVWAANEAGLEHEVINIDLKSGGGRKPEYLAINPNGKVPALVDGDEILFESAAICTYIGDKVPEKGLTPKYGTIERARYNQWMFWVIGDLEQPLWTMAKHNFILPEKLRVPAIMETCKYEFSVVCKVLAKEFGDRQFIMGDTFTMADVMVGHTLMWAQQFLGGLEHDNLTAYVGRLMPRPALAATMSQQSSAS